MPDYEFLTHEGLTHKDKLVLLAAAVWDIDDPKVLAPKLSMSVPSVRSSLAKSGLDPERERTLRDEVTDAVIAACGIDRASMRQKDWTHLAKVVAELIEAGADADEVRRRARNLHHRIHVALTPGALEKYWAQLGDVSPYSPRSVFG